MSLNRTRLSKSASQLKRYAINDLIDCQHLPLDLRDYEDFHRASEVQARDLPEGARVEASLGMDGEDGWETEYSVTVIRPTPPLGGDWPGKPAKVATWTWLDGDNEEPLGREVALKLVPSSLEVHVVSSVKVVSAASSVHHFEIERDPDHQVKY